MNKAASTQIAAIVADVITGAEEIAALHPLTTPIEVLAVQASINSAMVDRLSKGDPRALSAAISRMNATLELLSAGRVAAS